MRWYSGAPAVRHHGGPLPLYRGRVIFTKRQGIPSYHIQDGTRMTPSNGRVRVVVGEHNVCDGVGADSSEGGQILRASEVFEHPYYGNNDNDIAILKVTSQQK